MISAGKILDWIGTNLGRLKTIGILVLIVVLSISAVKYGCSRGDAEDMVERITGLNVQNDILRRGVINRDSIISAKDSLNSRLRDSIMLSEIANRKLKSDYNDLKRKYGAISEGLLIISADSSYAFLTRTAYPYNGELKFPFNELQVKGIHRTYLQKDNLVAMNINLMDQVTELGKQNMLKDTLSLALESNIMLMKDNRNDLETVISNKDEEIKIKDKQLKKAKRKRIVQVVGASVTVAILMFLAGG